MTDNLLAGGDNLPEFDQNKNYYPELVGEGKKFKDNEALAKGKYQADAYVSIMERKLDALRKDYEKVREENMARAKLEELIDQISKKPPTTENLMARDGDINQQQQKPQLDTKEIESLVSNTVTNRIQEHELTRKREDNFQSIKSKLIEKYGNNYHTVVRDQINDLGMSEDVFNDMARNNPKMVTRALGLDVKQQTENYQTPPRSQFGFNKQPEQQRSWSYYQELKKSNPKLYHDPKTNLQMIKDYQQLGDKFEDGDFKQANRNNFLI